MAEKAYSSQLDAEHVVSYIAPKGLLEQRLKNFESRPQQCQMVENVVGAYNENGIALIEAETGTGKSIAYLLPAILWALKNKERTLISTHTITLQEQLILKDIPLLVKILGVDIKTALVKGMGNYLCLRKLQDLKLEYPLMDAETIAQCTEIEAWAETTSEGSKATLPIPPSTAIWDNVGAESDTCNHIKCPYYQQCFFFKARREAEEAQILVANHHLLFADLAVRADTNNYDTSAILPQYTRAVIDEAHHIEDVATDFLSAQISKLGFLRTMHRIYSDKSKKNQDRLSLLREKLHNAFSASPSRHHSNALSLVTFELPALALNVKKHLTTFFDALEFFLEQQHLGTSEKEERTQAETKMRLFPSHYATSFWLEEIDPKGKLFIDALKRYVQVLASLENAIKTFEHDKFQEQSRSIRSDLIAFSQRLAAACELLVNFLSSPQSDKKVRWIECHHMKMLNNISLIDADLDVSEQMAKLFFKKISTVVLCSATLTTNHHFAFIQKRLGITQQLLPEKKIQTHTYSSPFNYKKQALFAIPTDLPSPHAPEFLCAAAEQVMRAIDISRGAAFVLFTSYGMMEKFYHLLHSKLNALNYRPLKQGDYNRQRLLHEFTSSKRSILFGTASFWEGVDIAGEALRCVIIVKLPFKVPTEPITQARIEAIEAMGEDSFSTYSLPSAIVKFKQGFGRLIRGKKDRGCILCLDNRLTTKNYGRIFLNSIPPCQTIFAPSHAIEQQMRDFYRRTHYMVVS